MKFARIAVFIIALAAGGVAAMLMSGESEPETEAAAQAPLETSEVLVSVSDLQMGVVVKTEDLAWAPWPLAGSETFITKSSQPTALEDVTGSIARQPIASGEPIRMQKLVKADGSGFMSAILPAGMRAIAVETSAVTGAGGFILPNDRVDVILTRKNEQTNDEAGAEFVSSTILTNVRVLAIDQTISEKDGEKVVVGSTATLELLSRQTEILALARQMGTLSLALRSLADSNPTALMGAGPEEGQFGSSVQNGMTVIRYGVTTNTMVR